MEQPVNETPTKENSLRFSADGWELLGIMILNNVLTLITLMLYYPWARVAQLRFIYQNASLNGTSFIFHGTGKELFNGYVKFMVFVLLWFGLAVGGSVTHNFLLVSMTWLLYGVALIFIIPLAIHGALRYRLSRTSWRGIHFGYRGDRKQLILEFVMGYVVTAISFGLYYGWFINTLRTYIIGNIRFGNLRFGYDGKGGDLFKMALKGLILGFFTLGIYYFRFWRNWMNYFAGHTYIEQNGNQYYLKATFTGTAYFKLVIVNLLLTLFTFGLGLPWVIIRTVRFVLENLELPQEIDFNQLAQTEDEYKDATGDDVLDMFDLGII